MSKVQKKHDDLESALFSTNKCVINLLNHADLFYPELGLPDKLTSFDYSKFISDFEVAITSLKDISFSFQNGKNYTLQHISEQIYNPNIEKNGFMYTTIMRLYGAWKIKKTDLINYLICFLILLVKQQDICYIFKIL